MLLFLAADCSVDHGGCDNQGTSFLQTTPLLIGDFSLPKADASTWAASCGQRIIGKPWGPLQTLGSIKVSNPIENKAYLALHDVMVSSVVGPVLRNGGLEPTRTFQRTESEPGRVG